MKYGRALRHRLEPLTALAERVEKFAALCEPDYAALLPQLHEDLRFRALDLDQLGHPWMTGEELVLQIRDDGYYIFTEWSRLQLLEHMGTREKWFKRVTLHDQALELTRRIHTFDRHRIRRMKTQDQLKLVRGFVSERFADIPDLDIVRALVEAMPEGESIKHYSGKSDKAFYAYTMMPGSPLGFGKDMTGYPGAIVTNSEVGAGALRVVPFFMLVHEAGWMRPVAVRKHALLRKVHRGNYGDLKVALQTAINDLAATWGPMQKRLDGLRSRNFRDENQALEKLEAILNSMKLSKRFINACTATYRAANHAAHNGKSLLVSVLAAQASTQLDSRYDEAEVAGYLLLHLV